MFVIQLIVMLSHWLQAQYLVLHQGDERGDDNSQALSVHWGELVAQTLPIACKAQLAQLLLDPDM